MVFMGIIFQAVTVAWRGMLARLDAINDAGLHGVDPASFVLSYDLFEICIKSLNSTYSSPSSIHNFSENQLIF